MSIFAVGVHTKLVNQGISPRSEEYYEKLDARMRQVFPEEFGLDEKQTDAPPPPAKKSNVAPATRSTAPKKIVLTQTQVNIAKRLGVPLELYARKVAEEQMRK
jgi:Tat protein secretion system quality control protein TatD with DNase activity